MGNGDLPPPRPDQSYNPPPGGQAIAGQRGVIRARQVIVIGTNGGVFVYSGPPALNNLVASISAAGGTDNKGNKYLSGIVSYVFGPPAGALQMEGEQLTFWTAATEAGPWNPLGTIIDGKWNEPSGGSGITLETGFAGQFSVFDTLITMQVLCEALAGLSVTGGTTTDTLTSTGAAALQAGATITGDVTITGNNLAAALLVTAGSGVHAANINGSSNANVVRIQNSLSGASGALLLVEPTGVGDLAFRADVIGDANARFTIDDTGLIRWGNGTASVDTRLFRAAAGELCADFIAANNGGTAEVWNAPTFANSWSNAPSGTALQYRLVASPYNSMQWVGRIVVPAGFAAGQAIITAIPSAYRPAHVQSVMAVDTSTGAFVRLQMNNTGVLLYESGASAAGDFLDITDGLVSLDA